MKINEIVKTWQWRCQNRYRLSNYVTDYLSKCIEHQAPVQLLTIWCLSKSLERRCKVLGVFRPLLTEVKVMEDFKWCHELLQQADLLVNHFILLTGSAVDSGQIDETIKNNYQIVLENLIDSVHLDILVFKYLPQQPSTAFVTDISKSINEESIRREERRRVALAKKNGGWLTTKQARAESLHSIAFKANEAKQLIDSFDNFLLIPVEYVERYQYHNLGYPRFTDRLLPIVKPYPWRLEN